jgi:hypothetical protein
MATTSAQLTALERPDVLNEIFEFVGPKEWLFLGAVSKAWTALYLSQMVHSSQLAPALPLQRKVTSYSAAAASLRRALYASDGDTTLKHDRLAALSKAAASSGSREVLTWARAVAGDDRWYHWQWYQELCEAAAAGNQLLTLQWLCAEADGIDGVIEDGLWTLGGVGAAAATNADLTTLQWICAQHGAQWDEEQVLLIAAGAATATTTQALEWLRAHYAQHNLISDDLAYAAVRAGAVVPLQWLAAAGFAYTDAHLTDYAVTWRQYDALRYLIEVARCPWDRDSVRRRAAATASGDVLEWLQQADEETWSTAVLTRPMCTAGLYDNLSVAKWLRAQGGLWPQSYFILHGHEPRQRSLYGVRTMQCALASGCPWGRWRSSTCVAMC